jgi:hypothetical protein
MFHRNELFVLLLVQVAITLVLSAATPSRGIIHPGIPHTHSISEYGQ